MDMPVSCIFVHFSVVKLNSNSFWVWGLNVCLTVGAKAMSKLSLHNTGTLSRSDISV